MNTTRTLAITILCAIATAAPAQEAAQVPPAGPGGRALLATVVVSGRVTGPGLWQVYREDGHDLWIMGTLSPLPSGIEWDASGIRELVGASQEVLWAPGYAVDVKANLFQQALLGIGYLRAKKNPDGRSLEDVLPPALYARWLQARTKYLPHHSGIERKRPIIAAEELLEAAVKRARLSSKPIVYPALKETIEQHGVRSTFPKVQVSITSDAAKSALADVRRMQLDDVNCLSATIDAVEADIPQMVANANAWANGRISAIGFDALRRRDAACADALMKPEFSARYGLPDIRKSVAARWLDEAEAALVRNTSTVAFVPMENLIGPGNYLDQLRARGYTIRGP